MRRLILKSFQSPGDVLMVTAAVRDLHLAHPGQFQTDVRTSADALWANNPFVTPLREGEPGVELVMMHYPLIHQSNQLPYHFLHGYVQYLEQQLNVRIPLTRFSGDVHLTREEKDAPPPGVELGVPERFWILMAGGKYDFTAKWWNPASFQAVVDHFQGQIAFVQCGEEGHWHPPLQRVINLVGKTSLREYIRLMYHAEGVLCPITFAMHLAATLEPKPGRPRHRPCVVIAGGREPPHWEAYPHHQFISLVGALPCCANGGCWKSRCQPVGDGDDKDRRNLCDSPVQVAPDLRIPRCMDLISPADVIRRIELYFQGGALRDPASPEMTNPTREQGPSLAEPSLTRRAGMPAEPLDNNPAAEPLPAAPIAAAPPNAETATANPPLAPVLGGEGQGEGVTTMTTKILIRFTHGLGDAVQLTSVLQHLARFHPEWQVDVASLIGKHSAFHGLCHRSLILDRDEPPRSAYDQEFDLAWNEPSLCYPDSPSSKAERCLRDVFGLTPVPELCTYKINIADQARQRARGYLEGICKDLKRANGRFPTVLLHYQGNTATDQKNLPVELVRRVCEVILQCGFVPVILDWDFRTPLADGLRIHNPHAQMDLWGKTGTGDAEIVAALIELSTLMVGVDSGPLHVAGATATPTLGVWTGHHPVHYFGLAEHLTHLVPENHRQLLRGNAALGEAFFAKHYRFETYQDLGQALTAWAKARLTGPEDNLVHAHDFWIRADNAEQDLTIVQDVAEQDCYGVDRLPLAWPVVVDVGAHIGCFARKVLQRFPQARIVAVECCPENVPALRKNLGAVATVVQAAVTYEPDVALLNAVFPKCESTGGSRLVSRQTLEEKLASGEIAREQNSVAGKQYWADFRPVRTMTLETLLEENGLERIDILKLDCEESEFSILRNTTLLERIGLIVGEYHGKDAFLKLVQEQFLRWQLRILRDGDIGVFWLLPPDRSKGKA